MKELYNLADQLHEAATAITKAMEAFRLPEQEYTIAEAFAKVRTVIKKDTHVSISPPDLDQYNAGDPIKVCEWKVYDGKHFHEGKTLASAVNKCLSFHADKCIESQKVEQIQELIPVAPPMAF